MRELNEARLTELEVLRARCGGALPPSEVVEFASDPKTALHSYFDWDDSDAAKKWRLVQARNLIRVLVTVETVGGEDKQIRAFVSLMDDRTSKLGYRSTMDVLADDELSEKLLATALKELKGFQKRYKDLQQLSAVFSAIDDVSKKYRPTQQEMRASA